MMNSVANPHCLFIIIARGGSKGVPRKNLQAIRGKSLLRLSVEKCLQAALSVSGDVVVSTENKEILNEANKAGAWTPFVRPSYLATDNVPSLPVVQHAVNELKRSHNKQYDFIFYIQPNSPFWRIEDLLLCYSKLFKNETYQSAIPITPVSTHPFKMKRLINDCSVTNFIEQGFEDMRPRQELPPVYRRAGSFYLSRTSVVMLQNTLIGEPCYGHVVPPATAIDIDTPLDLEFARLIAASHHD